MNALFHYCSAETFRVIVESRTIRLSSLLQSNDSSEGRLALEAMIRLASEDNLDEVASGRIREDLEVLTSRYDGLGFCMSEEGDLLSQWRGYGDDGYGFSIGFNPNYLRELCADTESDSRGQVYLSQVEYEKRRHDGIMRVFYAGARDRLRSNDWRPPKPGTMAHAVASLDPEHQKRSFESSFKIGNILSESLHWHFLLKSEAFSEEKEWRVLSHRRTASIEGFGIRAARDRLIIYRELELKALTVEPIAKVYLGPKNRTPRSIVQRFLQSRAFSKVEVQESAASYR